jgi:Rad3-related DNA helicase
MESPISKYFPYDSFREKQYDVLQECLYSLYEEGYDNIVLDAPTGSGKSGINTTLLRYADNGFYTTPQKSLREQLQNDPDLQDYIKSLKAREDYYCTVSNDNCKECYVNQDDEESCAEQGDCTYWNNKLAAIGKNIAAITFRYLIVDGKLPAENSEGVPISFKNREMLVVDEAHGLIQQTESLHAGTKIHPWSLPDEVFKGSTSQVPLNATKYTNPKVVEAVDTVYKRCDEYVGGANPMEMGKEQKRCHRLMEDIKWIRSEEEDGRPWVVDVDTVSHGGGRKKYLELTPTDVSSYLKRNVWRRAEKRVISTATPPYRGNPSVWLRKIGLDPDNTKIINVSSTFPVENRPIYTDKMVCSMSGNGDKDNWDEIMKTLDDLSETYYNRKGLIHTSSYPRANRVIDSIDPDEHIYLDDNVMVHKQNKNADGQIKEWQESDKDIFLSPSVMEGVDLKDSMCRWQVLLKVPYPSKNSRIEYMLNEEKYGWPQYFERAFLRVVQSYGRAVRSKNDVADYIILDKDFNKLMKRRTAPEWFEEAVTDEPKEERGIFDY